MFNSNYSVCSLVWPRTEETISGTIAVKNSKRPSKRGWEGSSYCPKYSKLCYDQFGGWLEQSNPPHLFTGRLPPSYWADLGCCCCCSSLTPYLLLFFKQGTWLLLYIEKCYHWLFCNIVQSFFGWKLLFMFSFFNSFHIRISCVIGNIRKVMAEYDWVKNGLNMWNPHLAVIWLKYDNQKLQY